MGLANNCRGRVTGWQHCDGNGDIDYSLEATGVGTLNVTKFQYFGVQIN